MLKKTSDGSGNVPTIVEPADEEHVIRLSSRGLTVTFGDSVVALKDVSLDVRQGEVLGIIGPSGCGKSTFLKSLNRMLPDAANIEGAVYLDGQDVYAVADPVQVRKQFGLVAQKAQHFPHLSIKDDVTYPAVLHGLVKNNKKDRAELAERLLKKVRLWDEVKDRYLKDSGGALSGGQQQRLCIARALSLQSDIMIMDEPCSALDPIATAVIEELIDDLRHDGQTIVIVTHNMEQAARVADRVAFFHMGELVELNTRENIFMNPEDKRTEDFILGRSG